MKNNFTKALFLCLLFFTAKSASAHVRIFTDSVNVILACIDTDQDKINDIKKLIQAEPGVKYVDYCVNHTIFLFRMNGTAQDADALADKIRKQSNSSQRSVYIKAYEFADIRNVCQSDNAPFGKPNR
jgi:hypothetical protein